MFPMGYIFGAIFSLGQDAAGRVISVELGRLLFSLMGAIVVGLCLTIKFISSGSYIIAIFPTSFILIYWMIIIFGFGNGSNVSYDVILKNNTGKDLNWSGVALGGHKIDSGVLGSNTASTDMGYSRKIPSNGYVYFKDEKGQFEIPFTIKDIDVDASIKGIEFSINLRNEEYYVDVKYDKKY